MTNFGFEEHDCSSHLPLYRSLKVPIAESNGVTITIIDVNMCNWSFFSLKKDHRETFRQLFNEHFQRQVHMKKYSGLISQVVFQTKEAIQRKNAGGTPIKKDADC
ncbi:hypothetical protein CHS0354_021255 [Potamilus streckersoni]|uniref:Uncharacterized protein n=1 Tax=Potamilus streckersoni TaxID=2493646 RepID=A0AAE0S454_9BIVA|nr:hypothetical protein CHS0354_021255 [Potamilus streckersoni]